MKLLVTAWPKIGGVKHNPGDEIEVDDVGLARMLIREGQAREAGTPEPLAGGPAAPQRDPQADAGVDAGQAGAPGPPLPKPGRGATKEELVAYAISQGTASDVANGMTRAQLTAHFVES